MEAVRNHDIAKALARSGVLIQGEAGVRYALARNCSFPPLTFTRAELTTLVLGAWIVEAWSNPRSRDRRRRGAPPHRCSAHRRAAGVSAASALRAPGFHVPELGRRGLADLRRAIDGRRKVRLEYQRGDGARSRRALRPLGLFFWGDRWSLAAWCELRQGFRHLRLDRIRRLCVLDSTFENELGRTLDDYRRRSGARRETLAVSAPPGCSLEAWTEGIRLEKERSYFDE